MTARVDVEPTLTAAEVAVILRCTAQHVSKLCKAKKLRGVNLGGTAGWRIHPDDLETFVRGRRPTGSGSSAGRRAAK